MMMRSPRRPLRPVLPRPASRGAVFPFPALLLAVLLLALLLPAALSAQWTGRGRVQGQVTDEEGKAVEGARVTLTLGEGGEGPEPAVTGRRGRWALIGLAGGRWNLTVEADGFRAAQGWAEVRPEGPSPNVDVTLRPLSEVSPRGIEANARSTVVGWLEQANSLLAQGKPAEARAEYEKAAAALAPADRAPVFGSIARTYFQEGNEQEAYRSLQKALLVAPTPAHAGHDESRRLFLALAEGYERGEEARGWLARLDVAMEDGRGPAALGAEIGFSPEQAPGEAAAVEGAPQAEPLPRREPEAHQTGSFSVSFTEASPLSPVETWAERYGVKMEEIAAVDPAAGRYRPAEETYEVYVPESYDPQRPAGLFVWVSPGPVGGVRGEALKEVLAAKNLIWIGANDSGNPRAKWTRMSLALDALHNMKRLYSLDPDRLYVGGYSGGGRIASALMMVYPEAFRGSLHIMGVDYFRRTPIPDKPGASWPGAFPEPKRPVLRELKEERRWVLLTGENDFNRLQTQVYYEEMERDGFEHVTYIEIPGADHYSRLDAADFRRAFDALDGSGGSGGSGGPSSDR